MQFMSIYTWAAAFRQPDGETRWKTIKWIEQENMWLQDDLLTSTYNTGPDGFVQADPKTKETAEKQKSQKRKYT